MGKILICQNCKKEFKNRYGHRKSKFCNMKCYLESYNKTRETITCKQCKTVFQAPITYKRKFCSQECEHKYRLGKSPIIVKGNHIKKNCIGCGKEFDIPLCRKKRQFCSNECFIKFNSNKIILKCENCNKNFEIKSYLKNQKFCSTECKRTAFYVNHILGENNYFYGKRFLGFSGKKHTLKARQEMSLAKIGKYEGKNHPRWLGGVSFEPYGLEFNRELKESIRKRDNYLCQECGKTQEELKKKLFIYCKQNNSLFNLISLCNKCHSKTNSNRKHWESYFKMKIFLKEFFNPENIKVFENKKLVAMGRLG